jgi:hypothetical protein
MTAYGPTPPFWTMQQVIRSHAVDNYLTVVRKVYSEAAVRRLRSIRGRAFGHLTLRPYPSTSINAHSLKAVTDYEVN